MPSHPRLLSARATVDSCRKVPLLRATAGTWRSNIPCLSSETMTARWMAGSTAIVCKGACGWWRREGGHVDSDGFHAFLNEFSRRDFLKRAGGAAGLAMLLGAGLETLAACASGSQTQA